MTKITRLQSFLSRTKKVFSKDSEKNLEKKNQSKVFLEENVLFSVLKKILFVRIKNLGRYPTKI